MISTVSSKMRDEMNKQINDVRQSSFSALAS
jgi:hypothetical protein